MMASNNGQGNSYQSQSPPPAAEKRQENIDSYNDSSDSDSVETFDHTVDIGLIDTTIEEFRPSLVAITEGKDDLAAERIQQEGHPPVAATIAIAAAAVISGRPELVNDSSGLPLPVGMVEGASVKERSAADTSRTSRIIEKVRWFENEMRRRQLDLDAASASKSGTRSSNATTTGGTVTTLQRHAPADITHGMLQVPDVAMLVPPVPDAQMIAALDEEIMDNDKAGKKLGAGKKKPRGNVDMIDDDDAPTDYFATLHNGEGVNIKKKFAAGPVTRPQPQPRAMIVPASHPSQPHMSVSPSSSHPDQDGGNILYHPNTSVQDLHIQDEASQSMLPRQSTSSDNQTPSVLMFHEVEAVAVEEEPPVPVYDAIVDRANRDMEEGQNDAEDTNKADAELPWLKKNKRCIIFGVGVVLCVVVAMTAMGTVLATEDRGEEATANIESKRATPGSKLIPTESPTLVLDSDSPVEEQVENSILLDSNSTVEGLADPPNDESPTLSPSKSSSVSPSALEPTPKPTPSPTLVPTKYPTPSPTLVPTKYPTAVPSKHPTPFPTKYPTKNPTIPCEGTWEVGGLKGHASKDFQQCYRTGPVRLVWKTTGAFGDDEYYIELYKAGLSYYLYTDGEHSKATSGTSPAEGYEAGYFYARFKCDIEGNIFHTGTCDGGSFKWKIIDCGCPAGWEETSPCVFSNVYDAKDVECSPPPQTAKPTIAPSTSSPPTMVIPVASIAGTYKMQAMWGGKTSNFGNGGTLKMTISQLGEIFLNDRQIEYYEFDASAQFLSWDKQSESMTSAEITFHHTLSAGYYFMNDEEDVFTGIFNDGSHWLDFRGMLCTLDDWRSCR